MKVEKDTLEPKKNHGSPKRILLRVAYDGTNYHGWQLQPREITIESVLNQAISRLTGEEIQVIGASRTDSGVHALGNIAVFDTCCRIPAEKFSYALNQRLPEDIVIQESREVPVDFHPRHCDCSKIYEYRILNRKFPLPEYRNSAHFDYGSLNVDAMKQACTAFVGEHDFAGFCSAGAQVQTTVRTIYGLEIEVQPLETGMSAGLKSKPSVLQESKQSEQESSKVPNQLIVIRVQGNGFLYNMVRIIAGTLLEVGKGRIRPEEMESIIASCDRGKAGPTAPARGLRLVEIYMESIDSDGKA